MIRAKKLSLVTARRTLRALYAQSQGYPYAAQLSADTDSVFADASKNQTLLTAFGQLNVAQIFPGAVLDLVGAETVDLAADDGVDGAAFGLSANFVGGDLDEIADIGEVGVWRGPGSVWIVLAPVFDPDLFADNDTPAKGKVGSATVSSAQGVIGDAGGGSTGIGTLLNVVGANAIIIDLHVPHGQLPTT